MIPAPRLRRYSSRAGAPGALGMSGPGRTLLSTVAQEGFELRGESTPLGALVRDLWRSRGLVRILARKDFFVRYRRASFGLLWAVGLPLVQAAVLAVVFSRIARFDTEITYAVFVFAGVLPWTVFSGALTGGVASVVENQDVATRIYFPRAVFPLVVVASSLYGFVPGIGVLLVMHAAFGGSFGPEVILLVPATLLLLILTSAFALVLAALQVYFRDVRHILGALMLPWFWASGVFFPLEQIRDLAGWLRLNPVVGAIELFHAALGAEGTGWTGSVWITIGWAVGLFAAAALLHRRYDRIFVDLL